MMGGASAARGGTLPSVPDDLALPFRTVASDVAGRLARLGPAIDTVLTRHDYPEPVAIALGEALLLAALLGNPLKDGGRLILQTKSDGPLGLLVANYDAPGRLRGYASFDREKLATLAAGGPVSQASLLGSGHLALTLDPGGEQTSYQGIVALEAGRPGEAGSSALADAAHAYFRQSEQLPTFIRLAVGRQFLKGGDGREPGWRWRAGGIIVQHVPKEGGDERRGKLLDDDRLDGEDDDNWRRVRILSETVSAEELIDPLLAPESLLFRLYQEEGVRVTPATALEARCRCSRERIATFLRRFQGEERTSLAEADGLIKVTCEYCSSKYQFKPAEL
ncbi:MAG TPA: Hsp33 family molecular chaperone [Hyphomicrobiaceae bacterium]|nr:Hsp33 family molecular chaperone [Hyphomicrobiaceae bacterium]